MKGACAGLGNAGCPSDADWEEQHEWLHENGITLIDPDDEDFSQDKPLLNGHTSLIFERVEEDFTVPGWHPPVDDDDDDSSTTTYNGGNNGPTCDNGYTVISSHVSSGDDGCRPPNCPFGRGTNGWCLQPTNTDPPVLYVIGGGPIDEDGGSVGFRVVASHATTQAVSVRVQTEDGTARSGSDYTPVSRTVTIPAGFTRFNLSVSIINDNSPESDETFSLRLSNPSSNAALHATTQATATIRDNDETIPSAVRNLTVDCSSVGVDGEVTVTWMLPDEGNPNGYYSRITGPDSYSSVIRTLPAGAIEHTFDGAPGWGEYTVVVYAFLLEGDGDPTTVTQTCQPTPPMVALSDTTLTVEEGSSVTIAATLDEMPSGTSSVRFDLSGTSTSGNGSCSAGADFYVDDTQFTFTDTDTDSITLTACDDADSTDETVNLSLTTTGISGLQLGSPTTVVVTITDDDSSECAPGWHPDPNNPGQCRPTPTPPQVSVTGTTADEDAGTVNFRITLSKIWSSPVYVNVVTSDGTANSGSDYTHVSRRVSITANYLSTSVSVLIADDTIDEPNETFTLTLSNPSHATLSSTPYAQATIIDNDESPPSAVRNLTVDCSTVGVDGEVTVTWMLPDEGDPYGYYSSITGPDSYRRIIYALPAGSIEHIFDEAPGWGDYTATVYGYLLNGDGPTTTATQTCQPPTPQVSLSDTTLTVGEGSSVQITATLDKAPNGTAAVSFTTSGAVRGSVSCFAGADFIVNNTSFTFTNTTSASITLTACDDTDTTDETVTLVLTTAGIAGLQLGSPTTVVVTVIDNTAACPPGATPDPHNPGRCLPPIFH